MPTGVNMAANAVLQAALTRRRQVLERKDYDASVEFNARMRELEAMRSARLQQSLTHTRQPIILQHGHPEGDRGQMRLLENGDVPPGFDEGMVRMASAIGAYMAKQANALPAAGTGARGVGAALAGLVSKAKAAKPGGAISRGSFSIPVPKPRVPAGVGTSRGAINTIQGSGSVKGPAAAAAPAASGGNAILGNTKPPAPIKPQGPAPAAPQSLVPAKGQAAAPQFQTHKSVQSPWTQEAQPGTVAPKPSTKPAAPLTPGAQGQPSTQRIPDRHARAAATPGAPGAAPVAYGSKEQVAGMSESQRQLKEKFEQQSVSAQKGNTGAAQKDFIDRARADLGNGKWKPKLLGLGAVAAGTYGMYRGAQGLANWMGKEPHVHTGNEGGVVPAAAVNQYGVPDRNVF